MIRLLFLSMLSLLPASISLLAEENSPGNAVDGLPRLVTLDSEAGRQRLCETPANQAFFKLVRYFVPQRNLAYCGVASSVMVLNALPITKPVEKPYAPFPFFTQDNFFTPQTELVKSAADVARSGLSLKELAGVLNAHQGVSATAVWAEPMGLDAFRETARKAINTNNLFVLVNYLRSAIGQETGGHISPLAAYHEASDSFLILDVAQYKYAPVWVPAAALWKAMSTVDSSSAKSRGYILISTKEAAKPE